MCLLALAAPGIALGDCPTSGELTRRLVAIQQVPSERFAGQYTSAMEALACLEGPVTPALAVEVHRATALSAYLARDLPAVLRAWRSVVAVDPQAAPPQDIPDGHPLRELYDEAVALPPGGSTRLPSVEGAVASIDGELAALRPDGRPVVLQWMTTEGTPLWTGYVRAFDDTPLPAVRPAPLAEPPAAAPIPVATSPTPSRRARPWWIGTAVAAGASTGLWTAALLLRRGLLSEDDPVAEYGDPASAREALGDRQATINLLGYAAQGTTGLALGLGGVALVVRR